MVGDLNSALSRYDEVFAVDTNTKQIDGQNVAVVSVVRCRFAKPITGDIAFTCWAEPCFELRNPTVPAERLGWRMILGGIQASPGFDKASSIAVVADAFLDDLPRLNKRETPVLGSFFVPPKCDLIYASADATGNGIVNHLISTCDRFAGVVLRALEENSSPGVPLTAATCGLFESFRYWRVLPDEATRPRPGERRFVVTPQPPPRRLLTPRA